MDIAWLGLDATPEPTCYSLTVTPRLCGRTGYLHGGCSLGAAATAMELVTGRPLVWSTAHYLARAAVGEAVTYAVSIESAGNRLSQARAVAQVGDRVVSRFVGAFGRRADASRYQWGRAPEPATNTGAGVPRPEDCQAYALSSEPAGSFHRETDIRVATVDRDAGSVRLWARLPDDAQHTAAGLAILGDYVPAGFRLVLDEATAVASSLDNTIRIAAVEPTDWVLLDISLGAVADGAAHGDLRMWSTSGRLLGLASQSFAFNPA